MAGLRRPERLKTLSLMTYKVLARKIIACKPSFWLEANTQLKAQYAHKLWDMYYVAMAHSAMQSSLEEEPFTRFWGQCLVST